MCWVLINSIINKVFKLSILEIICLMSSLVHNSSSFELWTVDDSSNYTNVLKIEKYVQIGLGII